MALAPGDKLGPYEIGEAIGQGGMGAVYRARDTRLGRDVAIKVSDQKFSERFEREARVISSLNHPNICHLYDVGDNYLVMELVEGKTLADRIKQGPIPLEESLAIARQIADALETAHEKGIVHRDLKPGNVMVKEDGSVKVLDFGLAKVARTSSASGDAAHAGGATPEESPTLSMAATQAGVILGTAAYMAPEQAKGKPVDKRADIWAFGVVLYEMVTGKKLFRGEDLTETLAAVVMKEPDLSAAPRELRPLLKRCLEKDPRKRLRDVGDFLYLIDEPSSPVRESPRLLPWVVAAGLLFAFGSLAVVHFRETTPESDVIRFQFEGLGESSNVANYMALSPDGRQLVYTSNQPDGENRLWIRSMDSLETRVLPGTEGATSPFWSPDSRAIGFAAVNQLKTVDASGNGPPVTLATLEGANVGSGAWSKDDVIVFGARASIGGLNRVSASGGEVTPVTRVDPERGEGTHSFPAFLPDGNHFLYMRSSTTGGSELDGTYIASIGDTPEDPPSERLVTTPFQTLFVPASSSAAAPGSHVLFWREGTLMAQLFDPDALALSGAPTPVAEGVGFTGLYGNFTASPNGLLAYRGQAGGSVGQITWFDRLGNPTGQVTGPAPWEEIALSPDGTRAVGARSDGQADLWMMDFGQGSANRFTFEVGREQNPVWSPDGTWITYSGQNGSVILRKPANGAGDPETLLSSPEPITPQDWSPDGDFLLMASQGTNTSEDIMVVPLEADGNGARVPLPFLATPFPEYQASFSPDGRWVVYVSSESGNVDVFVRPFTMPSASSSGVPPGGKWQISIGGGMQPRWNPNGKEILYLSPSGMMMSVAVNGDGVAFQAQTPQPLFPVNITLGPQYVTAIPFWDIASDGERFLINSAVDTGTSELITVVLNWEEELNR